jgi:NADPH2:quinone reductase
MRIIAENGTIVSYGSALDMRPQLPFYPLMFKAVTLELMLVYLVTPKQRRAAIEKLSKLLNGNALDVQVDRSFALSDCAKAHEFVESGQRKGAVVLTV